MELSVSHQLFVFISMTLCGVAAGVIFDLFRAVRRCIKASSGVILTQDLLLWFFELVLVYYTMFKVNNAKIRGYEAIALVIGSVLYFVTVSCYVTKAFSKVISFLLKILRTLLIPLKKVCLILAKPAKKLCSSSKKQFITLKSSVKTKISSRKAEISGKKHKI